MDTYYRSYKGGFIIGVMRGLGEFRELRGLKGRAQIGFFGEGGVGRQVGYIWDVGT